MPIRGGEVDASELRHAPTADGRTVLAVAAEPLARYGLASAVGSRFDVVDGVGTLAQAVRVLERWSPSITILLLDPALPDASIPDTLSTLAMHGSRTSVIALFRQCERDIVEVARRSGVRGFLDTFVTA